MSIERAWAAGFFDGEGCTSSNQGHPNISITQNDPEVLERFKKACQNVGRISGPWPYKKGKPNRFYWTYSVTDLYEVQIVVESLWPYLSTIKKVQMKKHLYIVEVETCPKPS